MGLGSEGLSDDGYDWLQDLLNSGDHEPAVLPERVPRRPQQQQQQGPGLRCPRCDSTNTKFCYYNNYSRTQPRHFCKACRRHWTNGGTLRNVPVGGRRKAKRPKTTQQSSAPNSAAESDGGAVGNGHDLPSQQVRPPPTFKGLLHPPRPLSDYANENDMSGSYLGTLLHLPPVPQFGGCMISCHDGSATTSSPFPPFLSFPGQDDSAGEDASIAMPMGAPWELLPPTSCSSGPSGGRCTVTTNTSGGMTVPEPSSPSSGYWNSCWDDLTGFLSADHHKHPPPLLPSPQDLQLS